MGIFKCINDFFGAIGSALDEINVKSTGFLEESRIKSRAEEVIKTDDFSSELERSVMLAAAEREIERKSKLAAKLASDPLLSKFYSEALTRIQVGVPPETVRAVRVAEEAAMNAAVRKRSLQSELEKNPNLRNAYEVALGKLLESKARNVQASNHPDPCDGRVRPARSELAATESGGAEGADVGASSSGHSGVDGRDDTLPSLFRKIREGHTGRQVGVDDPSAHVVNFGRMDDRRPFLPPAETTNRVTKSAAESLAQLFGTINVNVDPEPKQGSE